MTGLTIRDFYDPQYTAKGGEVPIYPQQMTSSPFNLHVHGVHVSPKGNADNVMLRIPAGMSNTYTYHIPNSMPQGAYWYHSHLHTLTASHVYYGLAGLLAIGRTDGNIPWSPRTQIPIRNMAAAIQLRLRPGGRAGAAQQPQLGRNTSSTSSRAERRRAGEGHLPSAADADQFHRVEEGSAVLHRLVCGTADWNRAGQSQPRAVPFHSEQFAALHRQAGGGKDVPADPALPEYKRDMQFTVNGPVPAGDQEQGRADRDLGALQCQRHRLHATSSLRKRQRAITPRSPSSARTGIPYPKVHYPVYGDGTRLVIPPATRYAIAVTMPDEGDLILEMPPRGGDTRTMSAARHPLH